MTKFPERYREITKVFIAGPLFNPKEREEAKEIADIVESTGRKVFLPHESGLLLLPLAEKLRNQYKIDSGISTALKLIYHLDMYEAAEKNRCDALIFNMNGRVPDEGAIVEATLAFAHRKPIIIYKNDARSLIAHSDNPLLIGLGDIQVNDIQSIPQALNDAESLKVLAYDRVMKDADKLFRFLDSKQTDIIIEKAREIWGI